MYKLVTRRYLMMGAGQYLRDFRLAHRQVDCFNYPYRYFINMKYKTGNSRLKIPFKKRSLLITLAYYFGKLTTVHVTYINKFGQDAFQRIYTKQELTRLCGAYGVETTSRTNKTTMATTLVPVIRSCSSVPNPHVLNNYRILANTDDNARRVVLRIVRLR